MSTPVPTTHSDEFAPVRPSPLVHRVFGEPRFHTDGDITAVAFAADGTLYSTDEAGILRHWAADGKLLSRYFLSDLETLWCFGPGAKLLASGNDDLLLWDVGSGQLLHRIAQDSWVTALAFSPDGRVVASGHDNGKVRFWDAASRKFLGEIAAHPMPVSAIAFAPKGGFVATAGEDRVVRVWDEDTHKKVADLLSHTDRIPALAWSPDGSLLVSAGWDTSARVWRPPQADPLILLNSHADQVHTLAFSPDGKFLACADSDFDIYLWSDEVGAKVAHVLRGHGDEVRCLAFSPDGAKLASAGADRVIHIWDVRDGKLVAGPNAKGRHAIAVVSGAKPLLASSGGPTVRVWDIETGEEVAPTGLCPAYSVAASPDGKWLAVGGTDHFTQLWNVPDGALVSSLEATKPPIGAVAFSADSATLAHTSPADGLVWLWKCATGQPELILIEAADGCTLEGVAFHPNGVWVACGGIDYLSTGDRDGAVAVWDLTTKQKRFVLDRGVYAVCFDPAGKYLAGAGINDTVFVWDVDTQETVFELAGHQETINAVCFDPTGSYLVSGGDDMTVRVWDVLSGRLLVARELDSPVQSVSFSPDGKFLFCGNGNTTCYQIETKKLLED
ncbi:MAG TPA: WD40 repeat domain-containing protein [Gemmataceae bacterium]|nr:WD40 repeat domain-containing protein [Gemmataceae bacterium]